MSSEQSGGDRKGVTWPVVDTAATAAVPDDVARVRVCRLTVPGTRLGRDGVAGAVLFPGREGTRLLRRPQLGYKVTYQIESRSYDQYQIHYENLGHRRSRG